MPIMQTTYDPSSASTVTDNGGGGGGGVNDLIDQLIARKLQSQAAPKKTGMLGVNAPGRTPAEEQQEKLVASQLRDAAQARDLRRKMFLAEQERAREAGARRAQLMKPRDWSPLSGMHSTWQDILSTNNPEEYKTYQAAALSGLK